MFASVLQSRLRWRFLVVLAVILLPLYGHFGERQNRHEVLAGGRQAMALVERSSGLQSVVLGWTDANGQTRTGEAWTRKQIDGRHFVGKRVAIQDVDDPSAMPVILSEVAEREWVNEFELLWKPLITIALVGSMIGFVAWVGSRA